jgi:outer membrane protein assembly factor BamB
MGIEQRWAQRACGAAAALLLAVGIGGTTGCASGSARPDPTPLVPLTAAAPAQLDIKQVWSRQLGGDVNFPLTVSVHAEVALFATGEGQIVALRTDSGAELWRNAVGAPLSAGVGSDGRWAAVVTRGNELVVLDKGQPAWRAPLDSRVSTPPLVAGERVFVLGQDRTVRAFDALDGRPLWRYQRSGDPLTLSAPGVLLAYKDTLLAGQGARLVGLDPLMGTLRWESTLASPRGTNEVERLADLVAPAARQGELVCARAFQAAVSCVDAERGSMLWTRNAAGVNGLALGERLLLGADASDRITAWRLVDGSVAATFEEWLYRGLSPALATSRAFVFGDGEGWVHWLSPEATTTLARMATDGSAVSVKPVHAGTAVLVVTRNGGVFAFRAE